MNITNTIGIIINIDTLFHEAGISFPVRSNSLAFPINNKLLPKIPYKVKEIGKKEIFDSKNSNSKAIIISIIQQPIKNYHHQSVL